MIPLSNTDIENSVEVVIATSDTYKIKDEKHRIEEYISGIEAVKQAIYKILMTERYKYCIYNWNYGVELDDLIGKGFDYARARLEGRITDALRIDDRIKEIYGFEISMPKKNTAFVKFNVETIFGDIDISKEIDI